MSDVGSYENETLQRGPSLWLGFLLLLGISLLGCTLPSGTPTPRWDERTPHLVWPRPPESARIEYLGSIRSPASLGIRVRLLQRLLRPIFGEERTAMVHPVCVAKNRDGLLAVTDPRVPTVHFFDLEKAEYWRLASGPAVRLKSPIGVALADDGRVYVADSVRGVVVVFDKGKKWIADLGAGFLIRPTGLALNPAQDRLYVVDTVSARVVIFDRNGHRRGNFGERGTGPGSFNYPTHIAVDKNGVVLVSDSLNFRVQRFDPKGVWLGSTGRPGNGAGNFTRPKGVATDGAGRFYVVDAAFENVQIFDRRGRLLLAFGSAGTHAGEFSLPSGIVLDSDNTIFVADSFNQRVQVFRLLPDEEK